MATNNDAKYVCYNSSTSLASKMRLPPMAKWRVVEEDVALEGHVVLYVKSRGLFWESYSDVQSRYVCLTRQGFLVIYMKDSKGFILNVPAAQSIQCTTDLQKKRQTRGRGFYSARIQRRCHIKLRFSFGNVHLYTADGDVTKWRDGLQKAFDAERRASRAPQTQNKKKSGDTGCKIERPYVCEVAQVSPLEIEDVEEDELPPLTEVVSWTVCPCPVPNTTNAAGGADSVLNTSAPTKVKLSTKVSSLTSIPGLRQLLQRRSSKELAKTTASNDDVSTETTNSGLIGDLTVTEASCRANPVFSVKELRAKLETVLEHKLAEEKLQGEAPESDCTRVSFDYGQLSLPQKDIARTSIKGTMSTKDLRRSVSCTATEYNTSTWWAQQPTNIPSSTIV